MQSEAEKMEEKQKKFCVVHVTYYRGLDGTKAVKELAVVAPGHRREQLWVFRAPYFESELEESDINENHSLRRLGVHYKWDEGDVPYCELNRILCKATEPYPYVVVDGFDECEFVSDIIMRKVYRLTRDYLLSPIEPWQYVHVLENSTACMGHALIARHACALSIASAIARDVNWRIDKLIPNEVNESIDEDCVYYSDSGSDCLDFPSSTRPQIVDGFPEKSNLSTQDPKAVCSNGCKYVYSCLIRGCDDSEACNSGKKMESSSGAEAPTPATKHLAVPSDGMATAPFLYCVGYDTKNCKSECNSYLTFTIDGTTYCECRWNEAYKTEKEKTIKCTHDDTLYKEACEKADAFVNAMMPPSPPLPVFQDNSEIPCHADQKCFVRRVLGLCTCLLSTEYEKLKQCEPMEVDETNECESMEVDECDEKCEPMEVDECDDKCEPMEIDV